MPGHSTPGHVSASSNQCSTYAIPIDIAGFQQYIKDENDNVGDNEDDGLYKPKSQLPKPFIFLRTLADLISR
jgi:hypothetical protein